LGDPVRAGETLAVIRSRDGAEMAADRATAEAKLVVARKAAEREQSLFDQRVSARQDLEAAQATLAEAEAEARRARTAAGSAHVTGDGALAIVSPLSGRITAQRIALGAFVQADTELFRVADPRLIQVQASISAVDAGKVSVGDSAILTTQSGRSLNASIASVTPTLDPQTRTASVVLTIKSGSGLTPGETLQARIMPKSAGKSAIVVPEEAVQNVDGHDVVFVRSAKGFNVQPVVISSRGAGRAAVVSGLTAGQSIATRNAFLLKAELSKGGGEEE
jgi:cobalt-zinc-cadmium efflux system membrane fusion protein